MLYKGLLTASLYVNICTFVIRLLLVSDYMQCPACKSLVTIETLTH